MEREDLDSLQAFLIAAQAEDIRRLKERWRKTSHEATHHGAKQQMASNRYQMLQVGSVCKHAMNGVGYTRVSSHKWGDIDQAIEERDRAIRGRRKLPRVE
jgi:hypothetical protein